MAAQNCQGNLGTPCLELQDALSKQLPQEEAAAGKQLPQEIHHKMLPASRTIGLSQTSKTMRTAVEKADAVVQASR